MDIAEMLAEHTKSYLAAYQTGFAAGFAAGKQSVQAQREPEEFDRETCADTSDREDYEEIR